MDADPHAMSPEELAIFFGEVLGDTVQKITRPGGSSRQVYRVWLPGRTVIAAYRPNLDIAEKERAILGRLSQVCPHVPAYYGTRRGFTFQQDAGEMRLSVRMHSLDGPARTELARAAYDSLFRIQHAAMGTDLADRVAPLDMDRETVRHFVRGPERLARQLGLPEPETDVERIARAITPTDIRFTKSDCRAGNAAIGTGGIVQWFDFEHAGLRHGAEDMGWLTADEIWPVDVETCCNLVQDLADTFEGPRAGAFMEMFRLWTVLQMSRRLRLIISEAQREGWVKPARSLSFDYVGTDPRLAAGLSDKAAWLARQSPLTTPLADTFSASAARFRATYAA